MAILLDTNILVYFSDSDSPFHETVKSFLQNTEETLVIATQSLFEFTAVLTKLGAKSEDVLLRVNLLREFVGVKETNENVISRFFDFIRKYELRGNRVYDALIAATAVEHGIKEIATFDSDFKKFSEIKILDISESE